jgi:hypothetical protein
LLSKSVLLPLKVPETVRELASQVRRRAELQDEPESAVNSFLANEEASTGALTFSNTFPSART